LSLGVETLGSAMTVLIPRNTTIPTRKTETFSTAEDGQSAVDIHVLQGERPMAADNKSLGQFRLDGIPAAPRGVPQIEVTFDIDANGILHVSARDKATGKEQNVTITASTNLDEQDIEHMVREAKQHEAEDRRRRELIETRNQADQLVYTVEKSLRELGDRISGSDRQQIENLAADLKNALQGDDVQQIRGLMEQLQQASYALSQQLYQAQQGQEQPGNGNGSQSRDSGSGEDEDVVEGEFQEV
jgi:molecular chaperone DnaK